MANKVIQIGENQPITNIEFREKYSDISMMADIVNDKYQINKLVNLKAIFNSLHNIFHWIPGERILNPEFGTRLYEILYNGINTFTSEQIIAEIKTCVMMWEPRVNVIGVINSSDNSDTENNIIKLDVLFTIPSLDDKKYIYSYIQNRNGY